MGCGGSHDAAKAAVSRDIDKRLKAEARLTSSEVKLLLLGAGDSGKSTLAKQMRLLYLNGYSNEEMRFYAPLVRGNVAAALVKPLRGMELTRLEEGLREVAQQVLDCDVMTLQRSLADFGAGRLRALVDSAAFQEQVAVGWSYGLGDNATHMYSRLEAVLEPDYCPTVTDVLQLRSVTTTISEVQFDFEDVCFRLVDVGGQRNERRKWIHCFAEVTAMLFLCAVHEFDLVLAENGSVNRMHESLQLFDDLVNSKWFSNVPVILFLNKIDLLRAKLERGVDPSCLFPDYRGGCNYDKALKFLEKKYLSLSRRNDTIYAYATCALDSENIRVIFQTCKQIILKQILGAIDSAL